MTEDLNLGLGGGLEPRTLGLHACALNHSATLPIISFFYWIHCQFLLCCSSLQWRYSCSHARSLMINTPARSFGVSKTQTRKYYRGFLQDVLPGWRITTTGIDPCFICLRKNNILNKVVGNSFQYLSVDAKIIVSTNCPIISEQVAVNFVVQ